jgi:hypothetical protein
VYREVLEVRGPGTLIPEDIRWIGQNMERLTPLAHLIHEVNMQSRSDMQRLLDAPAPALMEGIL